MNDQKFTSAVLNSENPLNGGKEKDLYQPKKAINPNERIELPGLGYTWIMNCFVLFLFPFLFFVVIL